LMVYDVYCTTFTLARYRPSSREDVTSGKEVAAARRLDKWELQPVPTLHFLGPVPAACPSVALLSLTSSACCRPSRGTAAKTSVGSVYDQASDDVHRYSVSNAEQVEGAYPPAHQQPYACAPYRPYSMHRRANAQKPAPRRQRRARPECKAKSR
jgi:hypothetical protein